MSILLRFDGRSGTVRFIRTLESGLFGDVSPRFRENEVDDSYDLGWSAQCLSGLSNPLLISEL